MLSERDLITTTEADLTDLKRAAFIAEDSLNTAVAEAADKATKGANASAAIKAAASEAAHKLDVAETNAQVTTLENEIRFLKTALASSEATIKAEREARVTTASNTSQPVINIEQKK